MTSSTRFLLEGTVLEIKHSLGVKMQVPIIMVRPDDDDVYALFPSRGVILVNLFHSIGVVTTTGVAIALASF
jgi:hypothetical protein